MLEQIITTAGIMFLNFALYLAIFHKIRWKEKALYISIANLALVSIFIIQFPREASSHIQDIVLFISSYSIAAFWLFTKYKHSSQWIYKRLKRIGKLERFLMMEKELNQLYIILATVVTLVFQVIVIWTDVKLT
jgi:hypothetical protein